MLQKIFLALGVILATMLVGAVIFEIHRRIEESREIHFVVPSGYRGILVTRVNREAPIFPFVHGSYVITFPKSGILDTASNGIMHESHPCSATYDSGILLNVGDPIPDMKPNGSSVVEFFDVGADSNDLCYWFVGTHDEFITIVGKNYEDFLTVAQKEILWPPVTTKRP